ncbi:MAG TPA: PhoH family protein [Bacteroidales bacterium]|jgi:phosphate starvation-inducible PhoH-like protein|nr:PhoH family protein [Bacteroidales bacterium]MDY0160325.1 PhoH family protein [Bacteroidales bacterium]HXK81367.1 PhoH family protein [Bacteroidales bacterium]
MAEKSILIDISDVRQFYGTNDKHLQLLKRHFSKLKIVAREDYIKLIGSNEDIDEFEHKLNNIYEYYNKYNCINAEILKTILNSDDERFNEKLKSDSDVLLYNVSGKPITARTKNQIKLVKASQKADLMFAIGPAGTGKTYTAIALAVKALKEGRVQRIILSRPAIEVGDTLGFLPGDIRDKLDPYLQPLYDALLDMLPFKKLERMIEEKIIQIAPLGFMRGRTLSNAFVILDEAQNSTTQQMKMFLTRMGEFSKFVVTGDITQIDLPKNLSSGLIEAQKVLANVNEISFIVFTKEDIIRHSLVSSIVDAYDNFVNKQTNNE